MAETSKGEAKTGGNPFPLYGSRREINFWEFSNPTGFRQNILVSTERPDSLKWKCFTKKHLFSVTFSQNSGKMPPVILPTQLESSPHMPCESSKSETA